jgi:hypothetical protein
VLAAGRSGGRGVVALAGADAAGTFYAAQTLRELIDGGQLDDVVVRDWPAMPLRGVIEGFYGAPWSTEARLRQLDFYGRTKQNVYVYSPKDDPFLRAQWRDPYPPDRLAVIRRLIDRAAANHVEFTYALSPAVRPQTGDVNLARGGAASASCVEGDGAHPQFDPKYAFDGDLSTRWSSCHDDGAWLQVALPGAAEVGNVVLRWETAYGRACRIETSPDRSTWTPAASVTDGDGGTDVVWLDAHGTRFVRMQGVRRGTVYGYSLYELEVYGVA